MKVDPAEIKQKSGIVDSAASTADGALSSSRSGAESARPGFPGDAAAPFATAVSTLEPIDSTLVRNAHDIATAMSVGAQGYQDTDYDNSERLDLPAVSSYRVNGIYSSSTWWFSS